MTRRARTSQTIGPVSMPGRSDTDVGVEDCSTDLPAGAWSQEDQRWSRWMQAVQRGDKRVYEKLLGEIALAIRRYLRARFGPAAFVEDITQECLLSIHTGRHSYDAQRPFRAWMFAIVRHRSIDYLRRQGAGARADASSVVTTSLLRTSQGEVANVIDASRLLSSLSRKDREIIVMTKYLGYNAKETGDRLGISVAAVRVRLHRALSHTRRFLSAEDYSLT